MKKGVVVVSIDVEFAWGFNYELLVGRLEAFSYLRIIKDRSRKNIDYLLYLSEKYRIPFTWAFVGHLFLSECCCDGKPHPDMPRPVLREVSKDWYFYDPCSSFREAPEWYAPDVVEKIIGSSVDHEIACHSFSHVDFSRCSREVARAEIRKCKELARLYGVSLKSFIFPKNRLGHLDVLREEGFEVFRFKVRPLRYGGRLRKYVFPVVSPVVGKCFSVNGLVAVPAMLLFQSWRLYDIVDLELAAVRGIMEAIRTGGVFHITMHDFLERDYLLRAFAQVLSFIDKKRRENKLEVMTMGEFADWFEEKASNINFGEYR